MKVLKACLRCLPWLLFLFTPEGFCNQQIHCQWGPYDDWSECDGCTKLQTRSRAIAVYAQFGGNPCGGEQTQNRPCETTQGCPLEDGCGDRFRCRSGKCVSQSLVCNGDQDCEEDQADERVCDPFRRYIICHESTLPPNIELLGLGFDVVSGHWRASVINTKSFGGQCRTIFSNIHNTVYRVPQSALQFNFLSKVQNDFSDETFSSRWHYAKDIVKRETVHGTSRGYRNYDFHESNVNTQNQRLLVLKNDIEVARFQTNTPQYITISEDFWKALTKLPVVYNYAAYRNVLERFGTHYLSEGILGGSLRVFISMDSETEQLIVTEKLNYQQCDRTEHQFLFFFKVTSEDCKHGSSRSSSHRGIKNRSNIRPNVNIAGGSLQNIAALQAMDFSNPEQNWEMYTNWAESVRSFPQVTKQKLQPLSDLVKEVQCAGLKKLHLRKAIEQYLSERDPCHCQPCSNNGLAVIDGGECKCICKPSTSGLACEQGSDPEGQQGVIDGSWSCWTTWSACSGVHRSRSRSCSNPAPQNGGQHCVGEATETSDCEDQQLEFLKTMEPQCFDQTLPVIQKCGTPPALINGYILDPKDIYLVGSRVQYTCTEEFYLAGHSVLECTANQTWSDSPGLCTLSRCTIDFISDEVIVSPLKKVYDIGETVTLSCPEGKLLEGEPTAICGSTLRFSPSLANTQCIRVASQSVQQPQTHASVQCNPWEKVSRGKCFCKMPFECSSSLELCATNPVSGKSVLINVCKMHALKCMGKNHEIAEDSFCIWPRRNTNAGCTKCHMWETCDEQSNECRCKEEADCTTPGINVCVRVGENITAVPQTMSECEAGLKRCKGEKVSVVNILPCTS
ncbi:complement component C7 isoform X3 [Sphaeramia orbicularis]|uniref:complement component C7 isoform X3 n=1 Tax=Sphaeramia orbicularis TaxID=375764 RepID=UPI00117CAACD|nr:complement component C7-like isoform X3 [Sphaeramia orbicularis]